MSGLHPSDYAPRFKENARKNHSNLICETVKDVPSVGTTALISFSIRLEFFCPFFSFFSFY